jgi:hypothetical protein
MTGDLAISERFHLQYDYEQIQRSIFNLTVIERDKSNAKKNINRHW